MGVVYRAVDREQERDVAIKLLHPYNRDDPAAMRRLGSEGWAGSCVHHPNVVAVLDAGVSGDDTPFLVMEYVRGRSLDKLIQTDGPVPLRRAALLVRQILAGIQGLHDAGFVHGDIKSGNVLVETVDAVDTAKLIDLGLARAPDMLDSSQERVASGTPEYMAPEVIRGEGTIPASDIYAAGIVFYQLLTGTTPFEGGSSHEILRRQLDDVVVPPSLRCPDRNIPRALEQTVMTALAKAPEARFPSAAAFADAIADATPDIEPPMSPGEARSVFSTDAPTREWSVPELPAPAQLAVGTRPPKSAAIADTATAAPSGQPSIDRAVRASLAVARALLADHRPRAAVIALEQAIAELLSPGTEVAIWPLQLMLSELYDRMHMPVRARDAAEAALAQATRVRSELGRERAVQLIDRLEVKARRPSTVLSRRLTSRP
jgi:serine/threonine-protein kinase